MRLLQRPVAVVLLVWYLPACSLLGVAGGSSPAPEWRPVDEAGLQQFLADERPNEILVYLTNGHEILLRGPVVTNGMLAGLELRPSGPVSFAAPVEEVQAVAVDRAAKTKRTLTAALVVVGFVAAIGFIAAMIGFSDSWGS